MSPLVYEPNGDLLLTLQNFIQKRVFVEGEVWLSKAQELQKRRKYGLLIYFIYNMIMNVRINTILFLVDI